MNRTTRFVDIMLGVFMMKKHKRRLRPIRIVAAHQLGDATGGRVTFASTPQTGRGGTEPPPSPAPRPVTGLGKT
jgi:hypothetical protein